MLMTESHWAATLDRDAVARWEDEGGPSTPDEKAIFLGK